MPQPGRGGGGVQRLARGFRQSRHRAGGGRRRREERHRRTFPQHGGALAAGRLGGATGQGGDGLGHLARLAALVIESQPGQQPREIGEADPQPAGAPGGKPFQRQHGEADRPCIAGRVETGRSLQESGQVQHEARLVAGRVAPDGGPGGAAPRQQQRPQRLGQRAGFRQAERGSTGGGAADPGFRQGNQGERAGARTRPRHQGGQGVSGAVLPGRGQGHGTGRCVRIRLAAGAAQRHVGPHGACEPLHDCPAPERKFTLVKQHVVTSGVNRHQIR